MTVYYNEHDTQKAAWLRELMRRNLIAPGEVDERSIEAIDPAELGRFTQCHFFAGIGVWSYALRNAGWSDSSPVWTGSCPCPSFSQSGKGLGFDDPRHLWPAWFRLIDVCRPHVVFGEQVASPAGLAWFDLVSSDVEGAGYAIGAADLCAAGVGAPHIRQRLYFVGDSTSKRHGGGTPNGLGQPAEVLGPRRKATRSVAESTDERRERRGPSFAGTKNGPLESQRQGASNLLGDPQSERCGEAGAGSRRPKERPCDASQPSELAHASSQGLPQFGRQRDESPRPSASGFWDDVEWLPCRDGKARPAQPGTFPLAHGAPARVVRLRGYGDVIVAPLAQAFIEAYSEVRGVAA